MFVSIPLHLSPFSFGDSTPSVELGLDWIEFDWAISSTNKEVELKERGEHDADMQAQQQVYLSYGMA